jgi:hypothetical protein
MLAHTHTKYRVQQKTQDITKELKGHYKNLTNRKNCSVKNNFFTYRKNDVT